MYVYYIVIYVKYNYDFLMIIINYLMFFKKCKNLNISFICKILFEYKLYMLFLEIVFLDWNGWDDVSLYNDVIL